MHSTLVFSQDRRRWKEAEELGLHVKDARLRVPGADHPDTLSTMGSLASTYCSQGRWKEAEESELEVRNARLILLGVEHPDTLSTIKRLAVIQRSRC